MKPRTLNQTIGLRRAQLVELETLVPRPQAGETAPAYLARLVELVAKARRRRGMLAL